MEYGSLLSQQTWQSEVNALEPTMQIGSTATLPILERGGWVSKKLHNATFSMPSPTGLDSIADIHVALGCLAFAVFVVLNASQSVALLPVGRIGSSLVSAFLMVVFGVVSTEQVMPLLGSNLPLLALVWGGMVLAHYLKEHGGLVRAVEIFCTWHAQGPWDTCWRFSFATSFIAAFLGWDIGAIVLAPLALKFAHRYPQSTARPFLAAVATGANAGSILTPASNPGNVIVTLASGMGFAMFSRIMLLPWALAVIVNASVVVISYANLLFRSEACSHVGSTNLRLACAPLHDVAIPCEAGQEQNMVLLFRKSWRGVFAYVAWFCCIAAWFSGAELGTVAATAAMALIIIEWKDSTQPISVSAEWPVIIYIAGVLITIPGFNMTGVPEAIWEFFSSLGVLSVVNFSGILGLVLLTTLFTNVVTNVPAVLLLGQHVAQLAAREMDANGPSSGVSSPAAMRGWLMVAFIAAMSGSLTVQGSITQVIAYEAGKVAEGGTVSFLEHLRVGIPVTCLTLGLGLPLLMFLMEEMM